MNDEGGVVDRDWCRASKRNLERAILNEKASPVYVELYLQTHGWEKQTDGEYKHSTGALCRVDAGAIRALSRAEGRNETFVRAEILGMRPPPEWRKQSRAGKRCAVYGCPARQPGLTKCPKCGLHHCPEHIKTDDPTMEHP